MPLRNTILRWGWLAQTFHWVVVALVIAVAVFAAFDFGRTPAPKYFTSNVERGDINDVVEATGTIGLRLQQRPAEQ